MKIPCVSIKHLMAGVGIVALNLAAARGICGSMFKTIPDFPPYLLAGITPTAVALQFALFRLFRTRGRARAFWIGFVLAGSMAITSFVWAQLFPRMRLLLPTGAIVNDEGSSMAAIWTAYEEFVEDGLIHLGRVPHIDPDDPVAKIFVFGLLWTLPQWLIGIAGGLVALLFARRSRSMSPDPTPMPGPQVQDPSPPRLAEAGLSC
jgi:hypothetical protein